MNTTEQKFWVEARTAIRTGNVMSYGVWHNNDGQRRECIKKFSVSRAGGWQVALHLANTLRDDLNNKIT